MKSQSIRIWLVVMAAMLCAGIYLTGFSNVSWVLCVPAVGFVLLLSQAFAPVISQSIFFV